MIRIIIVEGLRLDAESFNHPFSGFQIRGNNKFHAGDVLVVAADAVGAGAEKQFAAGVLGRSNRAGNPLRNAIGSVAESIGNRAGAAQQTEIN